MGANQEGTDILINGAGHTVGGRGTLGGSGLQLINHGIIAPVEMEYSWGDFEGGTDPAVLTIDGGMSFTETAKLEIDIEDDAYYDGDFDVLQFLNGDIILDGELDIVMNDDYIQASDTFTIINATDASQVQGTFSNLTPGGRVLTSDGSGSFLVTFNGGQVTLSDYQSGPTTPGTNPEEDWAWENFGDLDPATEATIWGDDANPDLDLFTNIQEYGFVLDPTNGNVPISPVQISREPLDVAFTLRVRQRKTSSDPNLNFAIELSNSLMPGTWVPSPVTEIPPRVSIDAETEWVAYQLPASDAQFMRINVTRTGGGD